MGQFEDEGQGGEGGLHRSPDHGGGGDHGEGPGWRTRPKVGPRQAHASPERRSGAERRSEQTARGAAFQTGGRDQRLQSEESQEQQQRAPAQECVMSHVLAVAEQLGVRETNEAKGPKATNIAGMSLMPEVRWKETQPMRRI